MLRIIPEFHLVCAYCCIPRHSVEIPRTRGSSRVSRAFLAQKSLHRYALAFSFAYSPFFHPPGTALPSGHLRLFIVELRARACANSTIRVRAMWRKRERERETFVSLQIFGCLRFSGVETLGPSRGSRNSSRAGTCPRTGFFFRSANVLSRLRVFPTCCPVGLWARFLPAGRGRIFCAPRSPLSIYLHRSFISAVSGNPDL